MKRKKWSEQEEQTLLSKYSELLNSGALAKLKTREKKFKPIADHVNAAHHVPDPVAFPFRWSWRDVSIKVQNMRHQYLGVKQKIRISDDDFNWKDGENHWENFLMYKEVFGDVELESKGKKLSESMDVFGDCADLGFEIDYEDSEEEEGEEEEEEDDDGDGDDDDEEEEEEEVEEEEEDGGSLGTNNDGGSDDIGEEIKGSEAEHGDLRFGKMEKLKKEKKKMKKKGSGVTRRLRLVGARVLELRDVVVKREERRREREFMREKEEEKGTEGEVRKEKRRIEREEWLDDKEFELEERHSRWARREFERRLRLERQLGEEWRWRMRMEEKREEEEIEWRERMVNMQIEHEKQMMQMHAEACQNQMQILGMMARLVCQFFGPANDGLGSGLAALPPQVLQSLQHPGGLGDNGKPDANSPSEFI